MDEKNIATILKQCGLCNRIKTMWSAVPFYDQIHTELAPDAYIFPDIKFTDNTVNPIIDWRLKVLPEEEKYIDEYKTIDLLYEKTPQYFIDKYLKIIDNFKINPDILEYVNDFIKDWDDEVLGVHIRTWWSDGSRSTWHSNSLFEEQIEKLPSNLKIFLCSDSPDTIKYFTDKYGDRIISHPQKLHDMTLWNINPYDQYHNDIQFIVDGFIDCLLLSKCSTIIGTWCSTFTECAWWFGGCKAKVIIPEPLNYDPNYNDNLFLRKDGQK